MASVWRDLYREKFDVAVSARWDPRNHLLLWLTGAKARLGFPRAGSQIFLTHPLPSPNQEEHRYENWRVIAQSLNLELEPRARLSFPANGRNRSVLIHSGAAQPVRVWPLPRYAHLVAKLRERGYAVKVVCNPEQRDWWLNAGEPDVVAPVTIRDLLAILDTAVGNDSGPGHLAAFCGLPTFTFFGDQVWEWFVPLHPAAEVMEGKPCPYKPCSDYCRFPTPHCLWDISEEEVWPRLERFVGLHLNRPAPLAAALT